MVEARRVQFSVGPLWLDAGYYPTSEPVGLLVAFLEPKARSLFYVQVWKFAFGIGWEVRRR